MPAGSVRLPEAGSCEAVLALPSSGVWCCLPVVADRRACGALSERKDGVSSGVALVSDGSGGAPEREYVSSHAKRVNGVLDVGGELPQGVRVPGGVSRGGSLGGCVSSGFANCVPAEGLVAGDSANVDVGLDLEHVLDEAAIGVVVKETLQSAVSEGGDGGGGAARGLDGGHDAGVICANLGRLSE